MESTEDKGTRLKRVDMHDYFLKRIDSAMNDNNYIEASWLIYACMENRYFRTLQKIRDYCKYCRSSSKCNKKVKNELAIKTKINCVKRLHENEVICVKDAFRYELFDETKKWVKDRNELTHDLLALEYYEETDLLFKEIAETGLALLLETYDSCTAFRKLFYDPSYSFVFPERAMEECQCKPMKGND